MEVHCPQCQGKIILDGKSSPDGFRCGECGSTFVRSEQTVSFVPEGTDYAVTFVPSGGLPTADGLPAFGDYEIIEEIARGGMGVVYKARQRSLNRVVALKVIRSGEFASPDEVARFRAEAEAAARLDHPGIVAIHEVGEQTGQHFLSMAFVNGGSLAEQLQEGPLAPRRAAELLKLTAEAVQHAHDQGVVHRDLKPRNILLDRDGQPRVTDFGLAKNLLADSELTVTGQIMGTPGYMSPEQARGTAAGPLADVYSLGATLYCLLTGRPPFQAATSHEMIQQVIDRDPVAPRALNPGIPRDLQTICLKCLRKEPERRYATASEVAEDLRRWVEGKPIQARPVLMAEKAWLWCKRRPALVGVTTAAVLILCAISWMLVARRNDAEATRLVEGLLAADTSQVIPIIDKVEDFHAWAEDDLRAAFADSPEDSNAKLHAALALLPADESAVQFLRERLLTVSPQQFGPVRDLLYKHRAHLSGGWRRLIVGYQAACADSEQEPAVRFQAACALATFDRVNPMWEDEKFCTFLAEHLTEVQPSALVPWQNALELVKGHLTGRLAAIYRDRDAREQLRISATDTLGSYLSDDPEQLFDLLADADLTQFPVLYARLADHQERAVELGDAEIARNPPFDADEVQKEALAIRQANAAVMLLMMDSANAVWPLLKHSPDPRVRTYIIHRLGPFGADSASLIARYEQESDVTVQRALLLSLGEFDEIRLRESERGLVIKELLSVYRRHPDQGLRSAAEWLLRQWGQAEQMAAIDAELAVPEDELQRAPIDQQNWYVNSQGQTFVILEADGFQMGSPESEPERSFDEPLHWRRIGRRFAISTKVVTKQQYLAFNPRFTHSHIHLFPEPDGPIGGVLWYEAAAYCNWLSAQEGIPEDQWCYEPNDRDRYETGMKTKENFLELAGYRLPTEAEWEFACRAGSVTSQFYGFNKLLLREYASAPVHPAAPTPPVAGGKPNDFGLFDMIGPMYQWCQGRYEERNQLPGDKIPGGTVTDIDRMAYRGRSRSADRDFELPNYRETIFDFRVARTLGAIPASDLLALEELVGELEERRIERDINGNLVRLDLSLMQLPDVGFETLKEMESLRSLLLNGTQITDAGLQHLAGLTNLQSINLSKTAVTGDGLEQLSALTNLNELVLGNTRITDSGLEHLEELAALTTLYLNGTAIGDAGLEQLRDFVSLTRLSLDGTQITDAGLEHLRGLTNLQRLTFGNTQVSDSGLAHLEGLTNLEVLNLFNTRITDAGLQHLSGLFGLRMLYLRNDPITDTGLEHLQQLKSLTNLDLSLTRVTDAGLKHLTNFPQLNSLNLANTQITDAGLEHVGEMQNLDDLMVSQTEITDLGLQHLKDMINLRRLYVNGTQVTDAGVQELQTALPDCRITR